MSPLELNKLIDVVLSEIITNISTDDMRTYITELTPYLVGLKLTSHQCPAEGTILAGGRDASPDIRYDPAESGTTVLVDEESRRRMPASP